MSDVNVRPEPAYIKYILQSSTMRFGGKRRGPKSAETILRSSARGGVRKRGSDAFLGASCLALRHLEAESETRAGASGGTGCGGGGDCCSRIRISGSGADHSRTLRVHIRLAFRCSSFRSDLRV